MYLLGSPKYLPFFFGKRENPETFPKYLCIDSVKTRGAKQLSLCVIETIWLVMETPKYLPLFFGKRENLVKIFYC